MNNEYYINKIKNKLNVKRFEHSIRTSHEAEKLAECYGLDVDTAKLAGILHDYAKNLNRDELRDAIDDYTIKVDSIMYNNPGLAHGIVGAEIVKDKLQIVDEDLLNSIRYHTTGRIDMSDLEKVIFIADYIEPKRNFPGVNIVRKMAYEDLDRAMLMALENTIMFLIEHKAIIHPLSLEARNHYLQKTLE